MNDRIGMQMIRLTFREKIWFTVFATLFATCTIAFGALVVFWFVKILAPVPAQGATLDLRNMPPMIMCGAAMCDKRATYIADGEIDKFGRYSSKYYEKRWKRMCKTGARYDAMREANDMGKANPC
jgi:hypothetical protein